MTPAEKALELVNKFYNRRSKDDLPLTIYWTSAIGCALIAVDEIIEQLLSDWGDNQWRANEYIEYWEEVKQEIEKL